MAILTESPSAGTSPEALLPSVEVVFGQSYLDLYAEEFDLGPYLQDHASSGDIELSLGELAPGSNVTRAVVRVGGEAFHGLLKNLRGTRVTASPLVFDSNGAAAPSLGGQRAFIIDFAGVRSVLGLAMPANKGKIVLVLPWMGTDFAPRAIYPIGGAYSIYSLPVPDTSGKVSVGFPAVETAKLFVQLSGSGLSEGEFANEVRIVTGVLPSNLRASVNDRPVFFTRPNALDREVELTGLADELNAIARDLEAPVAVTLKLATDTPGALLPTFAADTDLEIERSAQARWGGRDTLDVALAGLMPIAVDMVFPSADQVPWQIRRIALELGGRFPPWRAFGPAGTAAGKLGLKVSAQFSVARRFDLPARIQMHGVALLLRVPGAKTELRLEIAADADGAPAEGAPLATVDLVLDGDGLGAAWCEALAQSPFDTGAATTLWIVLKGKSGATEWIAQSELSPQPPATLYANEGGRWQRYPVRAGQSPAPLLRILREPLARENAPLVTVSLASATGAVITLAVDPSDERPATLDLALPELDPITATPSDGIVVAPVMVTAAATGTAVIRRATAYFTTE